MPMIFYADVKSLWIKLLIVFSLQVHVLMTYQEKKEIKKETFPDHQCGLFS